MSHASLQLSLRLDPADVFGALEWVLANARRTGVALHDLSVATAARPLARLTVTAAEPDLLHLFARRLGNGIDVEVLDADFSDISDNVAPALAGLAPAEAFAAAHA